jgi:hypothetical protein
MDGSELVERLRVLHGGGDPEAAHSEADRLLVQFAEEHAGGLNPGEIETAYDEIEKWYA